MQADAAQDGSKVGLVPGATYTVENLLYGMMLPSGNDAAHALANAVGGDAAAAALLNAKAARLGAFDTVAVNTSGLDAEGQVSSAYDLALVQANGLKDPAWRQVYGTERYAFPAGPVPEGMPRPTFEIATKNRLALDDYPGTIGGKTGYTNASLRTFVAAVERDGHTLVATFMRFNGNTETIATQTFDWAFANRGLLKPVGELVSPGSVETTPSPTVSPVATAAPTPTAQPTPTAAPPTPVTEPETTPEPSAERGVRGAGCGLERAAGRPVIGELAAPRRQRGARRARDAHHRSHRPRATCAGGARSPCRRADVTAHAPHSNSHRLDQLIQISTPMVSANVP